jgi:hypothetical protein
MGRPHVSIRELHNGHMPQVRRFYFLQVISANKTGARTSVVGASDSEDIVLTNR